VKPARVCNGTLATPVLWYRHAGTRRVLTLVLVSHVGSPGYFATMRLRVAELESAGAVVRCEGITPAPEADLAAATDDERAAQHFLITVFREQLTASVARLGWIYQAEGLPESRRWADADMTDLELVRAIGADVILAMAAASDKALALYGPGRRDALAAAMVPLVLRRMALPHRPDRTGARISPAIPAVLLEQRSAAAAAAADPARDTVMIWGAEHADSLGAGLAAGGWRQCAARRWLTVGQLPPLGRNLADLAAVMAGAAADAFRAARQDESILDIAG
jgi:hypothetical protein